MVFLLNNPLERRADLISMANYGLLYVSWEETLYTMENSKTCIPIAFHREPRGLLWFIVTKQWMYSLRVIIVGKNLTDYGYMI